MFKNLLISLFTVTCLSLVPMLTLAQGIGSFEIMTENNPPFNFQDNGKMKGISTEILQNIFKANGRTINSADIKILPWPRAYKTVSTNANKILFSMARTEQREKMFKWVGPLYHLTIGLIANKQKNFVINSVADLADYKIGSVPKGAPEQLLIKAGFDESKLDKKSSPITNLKKLNVDRLDMFVFNVPAAKYMMNQLGMNPNDYEMVYALKKVDLYIAFSKATGDKIINTLQASLDKLKKKGSNGKSQYDMIVETYF